VSPLAQFVIFGVCFALSVFLLGLMLIASALEGWWGIAVALAVALAVTVYAGIRTADFQRAHRERGQFRDRLIEWWRT
jgi:uncharacterized membrane protein